MPCHSTQGRVADLTQAIAIYQRRRFGATPLPPPSWSQQGPATRRASSRLNSRSSVNRKLLLMEKPAASDRSSRVSPLAHCREACPVRLLPTSMSLHPAPEHNSKVALPMQNLQTSRRKRPRPAARNLQTPRQRRSARQCASPAARNQLTASLQRKGLAQERPASLHNPWQTLGRRCMRWLSTELRF